MDKENVVHKQNILYLEAKKEKKKIKTDICNKMNRTENYYIKWSIPDLEK